MAGKMEAKPKNKKYKIPSGPFLRDVVVLLTGPNDKIVPRQGNRVWLSEHGHMLTGFQFYKEWNASQVEIAIKQAFAEKIPSDTDFEILASVHSSFVVPGQSGLDGMMIHRIFKAKPVYVRPVDQIVNPGFLPPLHNITEVLYAQTTVSNNFILQQQRNRCKHKCMCMLPYFQVIARHNFYFNFVLQKEESDQPV